MEKKEFAFKGAVQNGFVMLTLTLALLLCGIASAIYGFVLIGNDQNGGLLMGAAVWQRRTTLAQRRFAE